MKVPCACASSVQGFHHMAERISILFDGANFYHLALKPLGIDEIAFDYEAFALHLACGRTVSETGKRFYVGTVREKEGDPYTKRAMSLQTKLFTSLSRSGWEIRTSKLRIRTETIRVDDRMKDFQKIRSIGIAEIEYERTREKGIDVKLAIDLMAGAVDDKYDTAIIVSSDSDLTPAMDWVQKRKGKNVEYIGFSVKGAKPAVSMINYSTSQRIFSESDLQSFVQKKLV